jgi:exonuclease III
MPVPDACRGHVVHVRLQPAGDGAIQVLGVYMPGGAEHRQHWAAAYTHLGEVLEQAQPGNTTLLTGDWNACLHEGNRLGEPTTQDRDHRRWAASHPRLRSVYGEGQRRPTFSAG